MTDVGVDCVGCHQLGGASMECVHDERHGEPGPRDRREDEIKREFLEKIGTPRCVQHRCGLGTGLGEGGQEVAWPPHRNLGLDAAALAHVRWVDLVPVSANHCLLEGVSFDFGCAGPLGRGKVY